MPKLSNIYLNYYFVIFYLPFLSANLKSIYGVSLLYLQYLDIFIANILSLDVF